MLQRRPVPDGRVRTFDAGHRTSRRIGSSGLAFSCCAETLRIFASTVTVQTSRAMWATMPTMAPPYTSTFIIGAFPKQSVDDLVTEKGPSRQSGSKSSASVSKRARRRSNSNGTLCSCSLAGGRSAARSRETSPGHRLGRLETDRERTPPDALRVRLREMPLLASFSQGVLFSGQADRGKQ